MHEAKRHVENELLRRVKEAERVYRKLASSTKEKVIESRNVGWDVPDGAYAFHSAVKTEGYAVEKYWKALTTLTDFLLYGKVPPPNILLGPILSRAIDENGASMGTLQVIDGAKRALCIQAQNGFARPFLDFFEQVGEGDHSACGRAFAAMRPVLVNDVINSDVFAGTESLDVLIAAGVRAVQSIPLIDASGELVGVLSVHYPNPMSFPLENSGRIHEIAREATTLIIGAGLAQ